MDTNSIEMSNIFFESGFFADVDPGFLLKMELSCAEDPGFVSQWGLYNNAYDNYDINACEAWNLSKGTGIKVAVIDNGIETTHSDLISNIDTLSYDALNDTFPSVVYNIENEPHIYPHGTAVAGIIAASENNLQVIGVAPQSQLMSISHNMLESATYLEELASGISWAWQEGADIINNSWAIELSSGTSPLLEDAISEALTLGRDEKGCVVVFAVGNWNRDVFYPAHTCDEAIRVGAIIKEGTRWANSNYGNDLDVVAPGDAITSTSPNNETFGFRGTSMAAPFVSGIAALILAVDSNLTSRQVKDIIEITAQKISPNNYNYTTLPFSNHPNGSWHEEMGYGLVDAYAAVLKAKNLETNLYIKDSIADQGWEHNNTQVMWNSPSIWIEDLNGNVIENPHGDTDYNVCVKIHNKNDVATDGTQKLYLNWAKAGIDLQWNHHWSGTNYYNCGGTNVPKGGVIGSSTGTEIGAISGKGDKIVKVRWRVPRAEDYANCSPFSEDQWHFCLIARVHDDFDILNESANNANMAVFVTHNNNVAWKNLSVLNSQFSRAVVSITNPYSTPQSFSVKYRAYPNNENEKLNQFAEVYITICDELAAQWNGDGTGFKRIKMNTLLVIDDEVMLEGVIMQPNKLYTLETFVSFLTQTTPTNNEFHFDIMLYDNDTKLIGGEHYKATKDNERDFEAIALDDVTLLSSQSATFTATSINEDASYTWFNQSGDTIAVGQTLITTPQMSQKYTLEVVADSDGARDYDEVTATVQGGTIMQITPNPASEQVNISYQLAPNISLSQLQIVNTMGIVVKSQIINNQNNNTSITVQNLMTGQYVVRLVSSTGGILDSNS